MQSGSIIRTDPSQFIYSLHSTHFSPIQQAEYLIELSEYLCQLDHSIAPSTLLDSELKTLGDAIL